jgi:hypothetical protein
VTQAEFVPSKKAAPSSFTG